MNIIIIINNGHETKFTTAIIITCRPNFYVSVTCRDLQMVLGFNVSWPSLLRTKTLSSHEAVIINILPLSQLFQNIFCVQCR